MAPWELTGKVRREERGHGVRKLPVPGAGWALQTPRRYSRCGGREQGQTEEERKCTWEENTQNLRHQTDKEVAFWGQRNTEAAPREALRHTSRISPAHLAHSDHPANTFRQEWRDGQRELPTDTQQPEARGLGRQRRDSQTAQSTE